ncbi:hypothetical protein [Streptomyces sp. NPDC001530]|uniref:hypothetical protein n=1 Tax=Streptomyces sp. NPDC001530 TaxID=3364582 RepID=UPI003680E9C4
MEVYDSDAYLGDDAMAAACLRSLQPAINVTSPSAFGTYRRLHPLMPKATRHQHRIRNRFPRRQPVGLGASGEMTLPRPGVNEGQAWANRQAAADYYNTTLDQLVDDSPDGQLTEALNNCPITERYVLDLAYTREPEPADEEDDL